MNVLRSIYMGLIALFTLISGVSGSQETHWFQGTNTPQNVYPARWDGHSYQLTPFREDQQPGSIASDFQLYDNGKARWYSNRETGFYSITAGSEELSIWPVNNDYHTYTFSVEGKMLVDEDSTSFSAFSTVRILDSVRDPSRGELEVLERVTHIWLTDLPDQPAVTLSEHMLFSEKTGKVEGYFRKTHGSGISNNELEYGWISHPPGSTPKGNATVNYRIDASNRSISVHFTRPRSGAYTIFDLTGKIVDQGQVNSSSLWSLNLRNQAAGLFLVKLQTSSGDEVVQRLVVTDQ